MKTPWEETTASLVLTKFTTRKQDRKTVKEILNSNKALCCVLLETYERLCDLFDVTKSEFYLELYISKQSAKRSESLIVKINTSLLEQEALCGLDEIELWINNYEAAVFNKIMFDVTTFD